MSFLLFFFLSLLPLKSFLSNATIYMPRYPSPHFVVDDKLYPNATLQNDAIAFSSSSYTKGSYLRVTETTALFSNAKGYRF